jgi:hypothetical protein
MKPFAVTTIAAATTALALAMGGSPAQAAPPDRPLVAYCAIGGSVGITSVPRGTTTVDYYWSSQTYTGTKKRRYRLPTSTFGSGLQPGDYIYVFAMAPNNVVLAQDLHVVCS